MDTMPVVFPLLTDPGGYVACQWDLSVDAARRAYWLDLYRHHLPGLLDEAVASELARGATEADARRRADACREAFYAHLDRVAADPTVCGRLDILALGRRREQCLREHGFADPYAEVKRKETDAALALLSPLLDELDAMPDEARATALIEGVFAGNIFDVGATETLALFRSGRLDFHATRAKLKPRPWLIDGLDAWLSRRRRGPHRAAVLFVDNAGCDVVLGMLPFARELLRRGTRIILTANSTPALNDVTHDELAALVNRVAAFDETIAAALRNGSLELIPSGCGTPLIDLSQLTPALCDAVRRNCVDLVVLEGMGRAVESNLHARFTCDALKLAMIKDPDVARGVNGEMYDLVMKYEPA